MDPIPAESPSNRRDRHRIVVGNHARKSDHTRRHENHWRNLRVNGVPLSVVQEVSLSIRRAHRLGVSPRLPTTYESYHRSTRNNSIRRAATTPINGLRASFAGPQRESTAVESETRTLPRNRIAFLSIEHLWPPLFDVADYFPPVIVFHTGSWCESAPDSNHLVMVIFCLV